MEHRITVCASSGAWGIQSIHFNIDFGNPRGEDHKTLEEIRKEIMSRTLMCGYTAILHYTKIDDNEDAVTFLRLDSQPLADEYIERLDSNVICRKELKERAEEFDEWEKTYPEWAANSRRLFLKGLIKENETFFRFTKKAYELIGLDVDDREKKRRIMNNLGFNRVDV